MQFVDTITPSQPSQFYTTLGTVDDRKNWTKYSNQAANDWASMYYQNAYNTALINYQNEYNSPLQQMLRYQEAGLNPALAANDNGNMNSSSSGAAPRGSASVVDSPAQIAGTFIDGANSVNNVLKTAQQMYDYINYGRFQSFYKSAILSEEAQQAAANAQRYWAEADWARYWNLGEDSVIDSDIPESPRVSSSPRARYMEESTQRISAQIGQLDALVKVLYPSQVSANEARAALADLQKQVLEGQKGAILRINTGNESADSVLQMVCYWLLSK